PNVLHPICLTQAPLYPPLNQINARRHTFFFFFFNDTATTEIYTLSLHDALPILRGDRRGKPWSHRTARGRHRQKYRPQAANPARSEEHTSELQSPYDLVCRLLLEKKKKRIKKKHIVMNITKQRLSGYMK